MPARVLVLIIDGDQHWPAEFSAGDLAVYRLDDPAPHGVPNEFDRVQLASLLGATLSVGLDRAPQPATASVVDAGGTAGSGGTARLSPREREVLRLIAAGHTHGQTATRMYITKATVDTYVERIRRKLGVGNKADLTRAAVTLQLCDEAAG